MKPVVWGVLSTARIGRDRVLPGLRIIGFERSAAIAFRVTGDTVEVLRILRRGQDIPDAWPGD